MPKKSYTIRLDPTMLETARAMAKQDKRSLNNFIESAIFNAITENLTIRSIIQDLQEKQIDG